MDVKFSLFNAALENWQQPKCPWKKDKKNIFSTWNYLPQLVYNTMKTQFSVTTITNIVYFTGQQQFRVFKMGGSILPISRSLL